MAGVCQVLWILLQWITDQKVANRAQGVAQPGARLASVAIQHSSGPALTVGKMDELNDRRNKLYGRHDRQDISPNICNDQG